MRRLVVALATAVAVLSLGVTTFVLVGRVGAAPSPSASPKAFIHSCGAASAGFATCHAILNPNAVSPNATPSGYGPSQLQAAYSLPSSTAGSGVTVAIVDAYDAPTVTSDVATYRSQYGLPTINACGGTAPTFCKVNQTGGTKYPRTNSGWATEISLDVDMVSAICPNCNILLVEASSNSNSNLYAADDYASANANFISNSWSGGESSSETSSDSHFEKVGKVFTFATGDSGYGSQYPATSPGVVAVGGTHLTGSGTSWTESAWSGAGSGCSSYEARPSWQAISNITSVCSNRAEADISAVADPNTGVAVYDSTSYQGRSGWQVYGGTSVATPIIASVYALANNTSTTNPLSTSGASYLYSHTGSLNDVTSGSNGSCGNLLCNAASGWDGPTGLGTPNGIGAF